MYVEDTIRRYVDDAASNQPTPGGGSIAALAGALGVSMGCMAANFTVGRKKFREVEPQVKEMLGGLEEAREVLVGLVDEDTQVYAGVGAAYGMPRETDEQKQARAAAIQEALRAAMDVPLRIMRQCRDVVGLLVTLVDIANPNLISDVGVAAILAQAACRAAKLNVDINLKYLKDEDLCAATAQETADIMDTVRQGASGVANKVEAALQ